MPCLVYCSPSFEGYLSWQGLQWFEHVQDCLIARNFKSVELEAQRQPILQIASSPSMHILVYETKHPKIQQSICSFFYTFRLLLNSSSGDLGVLSLVSFSASPKIEWIVKCPLYKPPKFHTGMMPGFFCFCSWRAGSPTLALEMQHGKTVEVDFVGIFSGCVMWLWCYYGPHTVLNVLWNEKLFDQWTLWKFFKAWFWILANSQIA